LWRRGKDLKRWIEREEFLDLEHDDEEEGYSLSRS
jgi:hypothetical protein